MASLHERPLLRKPHPPLVSETRITGKPLATILFLLGLGMAFNLGAGSYFLFPPR